MKTNTKYAFAVAFALFFVGAIVTTYCALTVGGVEGNVVLSKISFESMVVLKVLFMGVLYTVITRLEEFSFERGVVLGSVIAVGLVTTLSNIGFYGGVW